MGYNSSKTKNLNSLQFYQLIGMLLNAILRNKKRKNKNIFASLSFFIKKKNNVISTYDNQIDNHA